MDKKEISCMKLDAGKKSREKVALAWLDIQETLKSDYPHAEYSVDELKGRWTSLKSAHMLRKKKKKSGDGAVPENNVNAKLDMLMLGLYDLSQVKETHSNISQPIASEAEVMITGTSTAVPSTLRPLPTASLNCLFSEQTDVDVPVPPASFSKSKPNDIGEKFLKCFSEMKDQFFTRQAATAPTVDILPTARSAPYCEANNKIDRFCTYMATCLEGFSDNELEKVQFEMMNVIVQRKRQHRSE